LIKVKSEL